MQTRFRSSRPLLLLVTAGLVLARHAGAADAESCRVSGVAEPNIDTEVSDDQGNVIARLTGSATPLEVKQFPLMPNVQARIVTSIADVRSFRIEGRASVRALGIRAKTRIEVVPSLVALNAGVRLDAVVRVGSELFVEKRLERDFAQTFVAPAHCSMLGFSSSTVYPETLPPKTRVYRLDNDTLSLFDAAATSALPRASLTRHHATGSVLFFAVKTEGNWVSLRYDGEVSITAWAQKKDLTALPAGEMQDQLTPSTSVRTVPKLALAGSPQLMRASQSAPLRVSASATAAPIGEVEAEAEFYVIEVVSGWANVVPRSLGVMPAPNRHFWIDAKAVGL